MIDLHSHVLPGVDDGAATLEESVEIARAAVAEGVQVLVATPHVRADYPTDAATMERLVDEVRSALHAANVPLEVHRGGELALDFLTEMAPDELGRFGLAGSRTLLLESPYHGWPLDAAELLFRLRMQGFVPLIGHPERNPAVQERPDLLRELVDAGALVQVTAASLEGRLGRPAQWAASDLVERELVHVVSSDAHSARVREFGLRKGLDKLGDRALARWVSHDVPAALLADQPLPPRPPRRRRFGRLSR